MNITWNRRRIIATWSHNVDVSCSPGDARPTETDIIPRVEIRVKRGRSYFGVTITWSGLELQWHHNHGAVVTSRRPRGRGYRNAFFWRWGLQKNHSQRPSSGGDSPKMHFNPEFPAAPRPPPAPPPKHVISWSRGPPGQSDSELENLGCMYRRDGELDPPLFRVICFKKKTQLLPYEAIQCML